MGMAILLGGPLCFLVGTATSDGSPTTAWAAAVALLGLALLAAL